jgi:L-threonylcarbamoyladenylate synthase
LFADWSPLAACQRAAIERALGKTLAKAEVMPTDDEAPFAPGMLASLCAAHADPTSRRRLEPGEALLAFGASPREGAAHSKPLNLSARGDLIEAAANLFSHCAHSRAQAPGPSQ